MRLSSRHFVAFASALALLCAQALGLAHAVAHPHAHDAALARAMQAECADHAHDHEHTHDFFDAQHDEGSPQCQLFDQVAQADGLAPAADGWTFAAPVAQFDIAPAAPRRAACGCGYHARGPPHFLA